eukprot:3362204-Pleurochrysis_carterae.AAC.2
MSPMIVQNCALPSMPATLSAHGLVFIKSDWCGWMCHVHPLSTTKLRLVSPDGSRRPCRGELRRWRVARSTRAQVDGGRETEGVDGCHRSQSSSGGSVRSSGRGIGGACVGREGACAAFLTGEEESQGEKCKARCSSS